MPFKDPELRKAKHKEYSAKHYQANKEAVKHRTSASRKSKNGWWKEFKAGLGCFGCEENDPATLEFHHVITTGKQDHTDTANVWLKRGWSRERILDEIKNTCVPLCANCHRKVHDQTRQLLNENKTRRTSTERRRPSRDRDS